MTENKQQRGPGTIGRVHRMIRSNWISTLGAAIATLAVLMEITVLGLGGHETWQGPYIGVITVLVLPLIGLGGLLLIPFGLLIYRKKLAERVAALRDRPMPLARAVVILTIINFGAIGTAGKASVTYMSSTQFCGKTCHVMDAENEAFHLSPHRNIGCVQCHVGAGAQAFVESKINGAAQLLATLRDNYSRPIPTPVHGLPPTTDVCEKCHSPKRYVGTRLVVNTRFEPNEKNTAFTNVLLMRRGGEAPDGSMRGIHWHAHPDSRVEYLANADCTEIPWVRVTAVDGSQRTFTGKNHAGGAPKADALRRMDCVSCHNRVGHEFKSVAHAVDDAMAGGLVSRSLPFMKKRAVAALLRKWARPAAAEEIRKDLEKQYADASLDAAQRKQLDASIEELGRIWLRHNYPERKLTWGSYPNFLSHDGCFRCHDGEHKDAKGKVLTNACEVCHVVLSEKQEDPAILGTLGIPPKK